MAKPELTAERLRELFHYDPLTGILTHRASRDGVAARRVNVRPHPEGYLQVTVDGRTYLVHRLAWLYINGKWPENKIDHKNTIRSDNVFSNLRDATQAQNTQNRRNAQRNNKCGLLGVNMCRGIPRATIQLDRKQKYLGEFDTPELAHEAYLEAKAKMHPFQTITQEKA